MFTSAIKYFSSLASVIRRWPGFTVAVTSGLSIVLAGSSLYIFAFAGRSMLPAPVTGDIPMAPYVISIPVKASPAVPAPAQPPVAPSPVLIEEPLAAAPAPVENVTVAKASGSTDNDDNGNSARTARISSGSSDDSHDKAQSSNDRPHDDHNRHDD